MTVAWNGIYIFNLISVELRISSTKGGRKLVVNVQHSSLLSQLFILYKIIRHRTIRNVTIFSIVFDIPTISSFQQYHHSISP